MRKDLKTETFDSIGFCAGSTVSIASGKKHSIKALGSDLRLIEVSLGVTCDDEQVLG